MSASMGDGEQEELRSAYLYRVVAEAERGTAREALFRELAQSAETQAKIWAEKSGGTLTTYVPDLRTRLVAALVRRFGPSAMRTVLASMKVRGMSMYSRPVPGHKDAGHAGRHEGAGAATNLRAAVFGVNDGLISNLALILGMAGAAPDHTVIVLTGIAGLIAGAFSMAAGEYVSVRSQREMYEHQIALERDEFSTYPDEEIAELTLIYVHRGMQREEAAALARRLLSDPNLAVETLVRDELGLNPDELGSPWGAATSSFLAFAVGAVVPLLPYLFLNDNPALVGAIVVTAVALFGVGATISLFTGRRALSSGVRMLAIGAAAGGLTFGIGRLLGVTMG